MGIKHHDNTMHIECDTCSRKPEIYFGGWKEAWAEAKKDGWRAFKDRIGNWCHRCPGCSKIRTKAFGKRV